MAALLIVLLGTTTGPVGPVQAADFYWDGDGSTSGNGIDGTNLGGSGAWDTSTANWWDLSSLLAWPNTNADHAIFTYAYSAGLPTFNNVTLNSGIIANQLSFLRSGYTLTGGDLTLAGSGAGFFASLGTYTVIDSLISGTDGLTKTGGGAIRLGNNLNDYTGATTINNGALIITNQSALGLDSSPIVVTGFNPVVGQTGLRSFGGGSLVLDGLASDITISRNLSLQGMGAISDRGAALISTGNNTLSGTVDMSVPYSGSALSTRIINADGNLNLTGTLNINTTIAIGSTGTAISNLGGVNQAGASFYNITGVLAGNGTLESSGGGTLFLNPSDSSGFSGSIRVSGSAASGQSVVRIDSPNVLGARTSGSTSAVLDLNGGVLAILMDTPSVQAGGVNANVYGRDSSTFFADHMPGSSVKDQTVAFGSFTYEDNETFTFNSRNGYGVSFTTAPVNGGDNNTTFNNNLQGGALLSFTGNFWSNSNNTGNRTMTIGGNGNTLINGGIIAAAAAFNHVLTKTGTGTLTLTGTTSTLDGAVNVNGGTVAISDFRAVTNNTSNINIGTSSTSAAFAVVGNNVAPAHLTTSKVFNLAGTTGGATLLANQTGSSGGLILNADFTATGGTASNVKTLTLGGTNTAANTINGIIPNNAAGAAVNLSKIDSGTWVLAGTNTYTGTTTISNGILKLQANAAASTILADTSGITFGAVNGFAGGTLEFRGQTSVNNVETLGAISYTGGGAATVKLTPGSGGTASLVFSNISTGGTATINFVDGDFTNNTFTLTQVNGAVGSDGIITRSVFWNGADYAYRQGGVLRAPVYGVDTGTATSGTALTSGANNEITGNFATNSISVPTIKFNGSQTLTINAGQTLTLSGAGVLATGGNSIITDGTLATGSAQLVARVNGGADSLRIESAITGTGGLTKSGEGTLVLAGANTRTGLIKIAEGTVRLASGGTLGGAAALTIHQNGILELNGLTPANNINAFTNNGIVRNTSATTDVTFTVGGANGTGDSRGIIEDGGLAKVSVVKIGTGGQNWLGLSTYTGTTTIGSTGIVGINNLQNGGMASGIGASSSDAGNLIFNGTSATQVYGGLSYTGTTNDETDRLFTFDGGADGGVRIQSNGANGATSSWTNTGALAFGPNATSNPQGLVLGGASTGDNRFFPIINDNGAAATSVYKADAGVWYLMAANGYSGATTLRGGALYANDGSSLPTNSNLVFDGGNLATTGAFSRTIGTGSGQMQWGATASGGFSAGGSPLTVDWGSGNVWGATAGFLGTGALLLNNSGVAKSDVTIVSGFDLGGGTRTVTVGDFTSIGADFATISGNIIGTGSLTKNGAGILNLRGDNTYTGVTAVTQGTLVVETLGNSASLAGTPTSVGISGIGTAFDDSNAIALGNGTTTGGILEHVGPGETSDRKIRLNTTTGSNQIHADGTGPLILTNVANDMTDGAKLLYLRGVNSGGNMVTSQLSDKGGTLGVVVDGSTSWILTNSANNYTGTTTVGAGALGIGDNAALGTGTFVLSNGTVFAYGDDRTLSNPVQLAASATIGFAGEYGLTLGSVAALSTTGSFGLNNNVVAGKLVTLGGLTANAITAARTWTIDGGGHTMVNGDITTSTAFNLNITKNGLGTLTLAGTGTSDINDGVITVNNGTLQAGADNVLNSTLTTNLVMNPAAGLTATLDLNGKTDTIRGLTANSLGTAVIDNSSSTAASLTFGNGDQVVALTGEVKNTGSGALSLTKTGTGAATFTGGPFAHTGTTAVNGGTLTFAGDVTATTALSVTGGSLFINGGFSGSTGLTSLTVDAGSTLALNLDSAGTPLSGLTNLNLGAGSGTTTLRLNIGDLNVAGDDLASDTITLLTGGTLNLANSITFDMGDSGLNANQTYTLLNVVDGGLTAFGAGNLIQGNTPGGFDSYNWITTNNLVQLQVGELVTGSLYWRGATDTTWNGNLNNWSTDKAGTTPGSTLPGAGIDVFFAYDGASGALDTTLEQSFKIHSLTFEAGATTPSSVSIASGTDPSYRLQVAPTLATDGVKITAGGPSAVTISSPFKLGADQTWSVADATSVLTFGGLLQGEQDVTVSGLGKVILGAAANGTFNPGLTSDFTITGGNLELTHAGALGTTIAGTAANVIVNGGAFYYNNTTAGTVNNPITLNGGTLSAGGATQTYNGAVNVSGNSFINMADSNGPSTNAARNITLSGVVSGSGGLTVSSNTTTLTGGNPESGTFTINNAASTWSGDLTLTSGTMDITAAVSSTVTPGDITFDGFGRLLVRGVNGQTITRADTLTFTAGTIGEYYVDNTSAVLVDDFVINQNGQVNIGSGGTGASARFTLADAASQLNIAGGVVLGGNSSISVDGGDADSFVAISGVISDGGSGYSLAINDDAGGWAVGNDLIRLTGPNTFTGNISLSEGTLEFDTVTNISGGASALGNGTAISMAGGVLRFIGSSSQSTNRPITTTASARLSADGSNGASITYTGPITVGPTGDGTQFYLTGAAGSQGIVTGGITQTGDTADAQVTGGTWTHKVGTSRIGDAFTVTGADTILNLNSGLLQVRNDMYVVSGANLYLNGTGVLSFNTATLSADASLRAYTGGTVTFAADNPVVSTEFDGLRIGTDGDGLGTLNMGSFNQTVTEFILGNRNLARQGLVTGTGTLTVTGNLDVYDGTIHANLASSGAGTFEKIGSGTVTLKGNNSGLAATGSTVIYAGALALDYTASNTTKLRSASALDMRGGKLQVIGNDSAATSETVGSFTLGSGGSNTVQVTGGTGQNAVLNLGAITRGNLAQDGTVRFMLPSGTQSATNGITTTSPNSFFGMLGTGTSVSTDSAYATVDDGTGVWFATSNGGNIVALASTEKDDVSTWAKGDHITDSAGFTGTLGAGFTEINSLRFNATSGSDLVLDPNGVLVIGSGGFLITENVGGTPSLMGGTLVSGAAELVITQDSSQTFEIGSGIRLQGGVTKTGAGTLLLSGMNDYRGQTEIQEGTLQVTGNSIGDLSLVTLATYRDSTLELLASETIGRLQGGQRQTDDDHGLVAIGAHTLTINQIGANGTYSGLLTGTGNLVKQGPFNLNLTNLSSGFTGVVTVDNGMLQLSNIAQINASIIRINKGGALIIDNNGTTRSGTRILDTTPITLNSADGTFGGETVVRGLAIRTDQDGTLDETVGVLTAASGASYVGMTTSGANDDSDIIANDLVRLNNATLNVRGTDLGGTSGRRNELRIGDTTNRDNFLNAMIGGGGAAGTTNIRIVPWAIAETVAAGLGNDNMGNSLATYGSNGIRALDFGTEYNTLAAAAAADNVRESLAADLTGLSGKTVNSLVIDNQATTGLEVTGLGAGYILDVTSGAMLFTVSSGVDSTAYDTTLGGFDDGITVGATNEYIFHVVNPSSAATTPTLTATISSPLTSAAGMTKSGRGTLILTGINTAGGGSNKTTLNEGALQIDDLDNIGGNTGGIVFAGGTLRFGAGLTDDVSVRPLTFLQGGGTIDTNGVDLALANAIGNGGPGGFTKAGAGTLTLNAAANWLGSTTVSGGTLLMGAVDVITPEVIVAGGTLEMGALSPVFTNLTLGPGAASNLTGTGTLTVNELATLNEGSINAVLTGPMNLIKTGTGLTATLDNIAHTYTGYTWIQGGTLSVSSLANMGAPSSPLGAPAATLTMPIYIGLEGSSDATLLYTGATDANTDRPIFLAGTSGDAFLDSGSAGLLTWNGEAYGITPGTKELTLQGSNGTGTAPNIFAGEISDGSAVVGVRKLGTGAWELTGANTYSGVTVVSEGRLQIKTGQVGLGAVAGSTTVSGTNGAILEIDRTGVGDTFVTSSFTVGDASQSGALILRNGDVRTTTTGSSGIDLGSDGYGYFLMEGGTFTTRRLDLYANHASTSVLHLTGGTLTSQEHVLLSNLYAELTVTGGTLDHQTFAGDVDAFSVGFGAIAGAEAVASLAGAGAVINNSGRRLVFHESLDLIQATFNLNAGTLITDSIRKTATGGTGSGTFNFNGGTLVPSLDGATLMENNLTAAYVNGAFGSFTGGAVIDTDGKSVTIAQSLLAPTGNGVTAIPVNTGGSGYIGAPYVQITDSTGTGATAYAVVDTVSGSATYGQVTNIVITNPGVGYTAAPTITLQGGGGSGATIGTVTTAANTSGGLTKNGLGTLTLSGSTLGYTGATTVNAGTLSITGSTAGAPSTTGITVAGGATLNLFNGVGQTMTSLSSLNLGAGGGTATLGLELGDALNYDSLGTGVVAATVANTVNFNITPLTGFGAGAYTLLSGGAGSAFDTSAAYTFTLPSGYAATATPSDTSVILNVSASSANSTLYWLGGIDGKWGSFNGSSNSNWTTDLTGLTNAQASPDATTTAYFTTSNQTLAGTLATTLESPFALNGLIFNSDTGTGPIDAITIGAGTAGTLTLSPSLATGGIEVQSGAPASISIGAPVVLGANQTWSVASGNTLTVSGPVSGTGSLDVLGGGTVNLTGTNTFTNSVVVDGSGSTLGFNGTAALNIGVNGAQTYTVQNGGTISLTAGVTVNPTSASGKSFVIGTNGGTLDVADPAGILQLDDLNQFAGTGNLTKTGAGMLWLGNVYSGFTGSQVTVNGGDLRLANTQSLGATGIQAAIALGTGGRLQLYNNTGSNFGSSVTMTGDGTVQVNRSSGGAGPSHTVGALSIGAQTLTVEAGTNVTSGTAGLTFGATTFTGAPTFVVNNPAAAGSTLLTFGAVDNGGFTATFQGNGNVTLPVAYSGAGGLTLDSSFTGTVTLSGATLDYTGATTVNGGMLNITGSAGASLATSAITVGGGGTLNFFNGAGQSLNALTGLNLGAGSGIATLGFELGADNSPHDSLGTTALAVLANTINFTVTPLSGFGAGDYTLLSGGAGSAFNSAATYTFNLPGGFTYGQTLSDTSVVLNVGALAAAGPFYWRGGIDHRWGSFDAGFNSNWTTDLTGLINAQAAPDASTTAIFSTSNTGASGTLATLFKVPFAVKNLIFNGETNSGAITGVSIDAEDIGTLTIASADGIDVQSGAPASVSINSPVILGASQNWNVDDSGTLLSINGAVSDGGNGFGITKTGDGAVALSQANTFTGTLTLDGGALIANGSTAALGTGAATLVLNSGTLDFNHSAALNFGRATTVAGDVEIVSEKATSGAGVTYTLGTLSIGENTLTVTGGNVNSGNAGVTFGATTFTGAPTFVIHKPAGGGISQLTLGAVDNGGFTATVQGSGNVVANGLWSGAGGITLDSNYAGTFSFGDGAHTFTGDLTIKSGTVATTSTTTNFGNGTIRLGDTAINPNAVKLTGAIANANIANPIVLQPGTLGTISLETTNNSSTFTYSGGVTGSNDLALRANGTADFIFSTNAVNFSGDLINSGTGTGSVIISADIGANVTNIIQGSSTSPLTLGGSTIAFTGATVVNAGTLNLAGSAGTPLSTTLVSVAGGGTLNLVNGAGQSLGTLTSLNLGAGSGTTTLGMELGANALTSDQFTTSNAAITANTIQLNVTALSGFGGSATYDLLTAPSGLSGGTYQLGYMPGGYTYTLTPSDTLVQLGVTAVGAGDFNWRGDRPNKSWAEVVAGDSNWSANADGSGDPGASPGAANTVIFSATAASGPAISTTLDNNYFIDSIQFTSNPAGVTAVNIAPGAVATNSLTLAPSSPLDGILVADNAGTITISAPVVAGANQTWSVSNTAASLVVSGALSGSSAVTKTGNGTLTLSADNDAFSGALTISAGTLNVGSGGATGSLGTGDVVNNSALVFNRTGTYTVPNLISGSGPVTKMANGILTLSNDASSFAGPVTVSAGTLNFTSIGNVSGAASAMGTPTSIAEGTISLAGTLGFTGSSNQSTDRLITLTGASTLAANGTGGATITYNGAINAAGSTLTLTGTDATTAGIIAGGITQTGTAADFNVNSGNWTLQGATVTIADDVVVTGSNTVLNLNSTGVLQYNNNGTSNGLYARSGATINLGADEPRGGANFDYIILGDSGGPNIPILNTNTFTITTPRLDLGQYATGLEASITGSGTIINNNWDMYRGSVYANLASPSSGTGAFEKFGMGTVTLYGDNSGLAGATTVHAGNLVLDYTLDNPLDQKAKINAGGVLNLNGGTLTINGNASENTTVSVASLTLGGSGASTLDVNAGGPGVTATLNLGAITRNTAGGTVRFLPTLPANGAITTTTENTNGILGGWGTIIDPTTGDTGFAANDGTGNIVLATSTVKDDVRTWRATDNVVDSTGFTGTLCGAVAVNSVLINGSAASTVNLNGASTLTVGSGGIFMTENAGGSAIFTGGSITATGNSDLILHNDHVTNQITVESAITGATGVTKAGTGMLVLSGNNTYTGTTTVQDGILVAQGGNAIGDRSAVVISDDHTGVTLQITGNETIGNLSGGNASALFSSYLDFGANDLTIQQISSNATFGGYVSGSGTLTKTGNYNLALGVANPNFTGALVLNGGTAGTGYFGMSGAGTIGASSITINKGASLYLINNGSTRSGARIPDATPVTLNSADGIFQGESLPRGLAFTTDQDSGSSNTETIGVLNIASGASYVSIQQQGGNSSRGIIQSANFVRTRGATLDVRGRALGSTSGTGGQSQLKIVDGTNETAFLATRIGGGGAAGTKTISIVPWAIGENTSGAIGATNMGNSLVTYVDNSGFRALDFATEYNTFAAKATDQDNIRESLTMDLTGLAGATLNALVLHNGSAAAATHNVTGTGASQTLAITSGALLFTRDTAGSGSYGINLGGFDDGITVGSTNEYVIHVVNPDAATATKTLTATISSPLNSIDASLVKSGRGTLVLDAVNTYTGTTYINEGVLQIASLDNIGDGGAIRIAGGTLQLAAGFADDFSTRPLDLSPNDGALDFSLVTAGITLTNGIADLTPDARDIVNIFTRSSATGNTGLLTIQGSSTFIGTTIFRNTGINSSGTTSVLLNGATNAALNGNVELGDPVNVNNERDIVVALGANEQIVDTATLTFRGASGENAYFKLLGFTETVAGISDTTAQGVIENLENAESGITENGKLIVNSDQDFSYNGYLRNRGSGSNTTTLAFEKQGTGTQTLDGSSGSTRIIYTGPTTISGGSLRLLNTTAFNSDITNNANLVLEQTSSAWTLANTISGTGSVEKRGVGTIALTGTNSYSGGTTIWDGILSIDNSSALGSDTPGNNLAIRGNTTFQSTGLAVSLGAHQGVNLCGPAANIEVVGSPSNILTLNGVVDGPGETLLKKEGAGTLVLAGSNSYQGPTAVNAGILSISADDSLGAAPGTFTANQLTLNGGTLETTAAFTLHANRGITIGSSGGTIQTNTAPGSELTVEGDVTLGGNLTKSGTGALLWNGSSTGTGAVTINDGTLGGSGTISGAVTAIGGTLTAGSATGTGTLTVNGEISTLSPSAWLVNLVHGGPSDLIAGTTINPSGFELSIIEDGAFIWGQTYTFASYSAGGWNPANLFTYGGIGLQNDGTGILNGSQGGLFMVRYDQGGDIFTLTAVPEPETWLPALLIVGLCLFLRRRRIVR